MRPKTSLSPRKKPVQSRSTHTVEAIFDATIQVLLAVGVEGLTTTRVAERAGVSVGTLYQYFPHKQALLAAVLERHLSGVVEAAEQAGRANRGRTVLEISAALVEAFVRAKFSDADASRALYAVAPAVGGEELITRLTQRGQIMLCEVLASASDRTFNQLATVSYVVSTALIGPIQGLLTSHAQTTTVEHVRDQLSAMIGAYLMAVGSPRESA